MRYFTIQVKSGLWGHGKPFTRLADIIRKTDEFKSMKTFLQV